jgi:hypothetical protein
MEERGWRSSIRGKTIQGENTAGKRILPQSDVRKAKKLLNPAA